MTQRVLRFASMYEQEESGEWAFTIKDATELTQFYERNGFVMVCDGDTHRFLVVDDRDRFLPILDRTVHPGDVFEGLASE